MCVSLARIELRVPVDWRCFEKKGGGHSGEPADALFQRTIATTDRKMNMQHATNLLIAAAAVLPQGTARVHVERTSAAPFRWSAESRLRRLGRRRGCGLTSPRVPRGCRRAQAAALAGAAQLSTALSAAAAAAAAAAAPRPLVAATTRLSEGVFLDGARDHTGLCASEDARGRARKMHASGGAARGDGRVLLEGFEAILLPELCQVLHPAAVSAHVHADEHAGLSTPLGCRLGWACPQRPAGAPLLVLVHLWCGRSASPPPKGKWPVLHLSPGAGGPAAARHDGLPRARSSRRPRLCSQLHAPHTTLPG